MPFLQVHPFGRIRTLDSRNLDHRSPGNFALGDLFGRNGFPPIRFARLSGRDQGQAIAIALREIDRRVAEPSASDGTGNLGD